MQGQSAGEAKQHDTVPSTCLQGAHLQALQRTYSYALLAQQRPGGGAAESCQAPGLTEIPLFSDVALAAARTSIRHQVDTKSGRFAHIKCQAGFLHCLRHAAAQQMAVTL